MRRHGSTLFNLPFHEPALTDTLAQLRASLAGRYQLERELGRGGMATVYLARDLKHDRSVALKVLAPELAATLGPERFIREIRLTAKLEHPHILPVLDSGEDAGRLWYTMPYVEGESLRDRLDRDSQLSVEEAVRIAGEVADALDYAHRSGVVHRDIKPENILLSQGHARVADFGVARAAEAQGDSLTATGLAVGTPAYMSAEQAAGKADARSDIYSLGTVLYEMLAGEPPFTGPSARAIIAKRAVGPVPSVRLTRPDVSVDLDAVIRRALSPVPAARQGSAAELASALRLSASGSTEAIRPRRAGLSMAGVAVALVALVAAGAYLARSSKTDRVDGPKRLAILPFENLGRPEDAAFADGLTLEITNQLAGLTGVGVISRASAMQYKGTTRPRREIGRELGVGYLLEGTVQWARQADSAPRVRVTPQLVTVDGDRQLWAERYDGEMHDIFDLQSRIAEQVASALHATLAADATDSSAGKPTPDAEAYILHLRGFGLLERHDPASVREAITLYEKAIHLDPSFALAHFYLGAAHFNLWASVADRTPARRDSAEKHLERAAQLGPDLLEIRGYLGWRAAERGDLAEANERFEWIRARHPNREEGWWGLGQVRERQGKWEEAVAAHRKFIELSPRVTAGYSQLANAAWVLRDYEEARGAVERGLAVAPDDIWLIGQKARILGTLGGHPDSAGLVIDEALARLGTARLGSELIGLGQFVSPATARMLLSAPRDSFGLDEPNYHFLKLDLALTLGARPIAHIYADSARRGLEALVRTDNTDAFARAQLAIAYAILGRSDEAVREAERAATIMPMEKDASQGMQFAIILAYVHALTGNVEEAVQRLGQLLAVPSPISVPALRADPRWKFLQVDPRFQRLLS